MNESQKPIDISSGEDAGVVKELCLEEMIQEDLDASKGS